MVSDITYLTSKMEIATLPPCSELVIQSFTLLISVRNPFKSGTENVTQADKTLTENNVYLLPLSKHHSLLFSARK